MSITFRQCLAKLRQEDLGAVERKLGVSFPDDYRAFLLEYNGGVPRPDCFHMPESGQHSPKLLSELLLNVLQKLTQLPASQGGMRQLVEVLWFFSIGRDGMVDASRLDLESACTRLRRSTTFPATLVPIAQVSSSIHFFLCISVAGKDRGKIYSWRDLKGYESTVPEFISETFGIFLSGLHYRLHSPPPDWVILIQDGDVAGLTRWLEAGGSVKVQDRWGSSPLDHAVWEGRSDIVQILLERGASATKAFDLALDSHRHDLARWLLSKGVRAKSVESSLAWNAACFWADAALVRALVDAGADVNYVDREKSQAYTPLHFAAAAREIEMVKFLLERGGRPDKKNGDRETPAELADKKGHGEIAKLLTHAAKTAKPPATKTRKPPEAVALDLHGIKFCRSGPALTESRLASFEAKFDISLPAEYRTFLLKHNGGIPQPDVFEVVPRGEDEDGANARINANVEYFYSVTLEGGPVALENDLAAALESGREWSLPDELLPIAQVNDQIEGGILCLSVKGQDRGQICYCVGLGDGPSIYHVADSFQAFLRILGRETL